MKLVADIVKFEEGKLLNYEPLTDHFVIEIPDVNPLVEGSKTIRKTDKQIAEEMDKVLGEYFLVVAVGPKCESLKVGDEIFMLPPQRVVSFKATAGEGVKRFAIFKEHVVLGKLQTSK